MTRGGRIILVWVLSRLHGYATAAHPAGTSCASTAVRHTQCRISPSAPPRNTPHTLARVLT